MLVILSNPRLHTISAQALMVLSVLRKHSKLVGLLCLLFFPTSAMAQRGVFLSVDEFVAQTFSSAPASQTLWLNPTQKQIATDILSRNPGLRSRYYQLGERTAWILEEIGKELPITVGVVVEQDRVLNLVVLEYREVRGGEVRYESFTEQFTGAGLRASSNRLDKSIDGISGATLSVRALKKIARLALYFHQQVVQPLDRTAQQLCSENIGDPSCGAGTSDLASH